MERCAILDETIAIAISCIRVKTFRLGSLNNWSFNWRFFNDWFFCDLLFFDWLDNYNRLFDLSCFFINIFNDAIFK